MENAFFNHAEAPLRIGKVHLRVRDIDTVAAFYERAMGLTPLERCASGITLGVGEKPLLILHADPMARAAHHREAGLFHIAFLLPQRADLARWLEHFRALGLPLAGASDHLVSEAVYFSDPEGNGIEVYADRPVTEWRDGRGQIHMATHPLDTPALLAAGQGTWAGFPTEGLIGHVHLQVGDTGVAEGFYRDILGFDIASRYRGASFFGSGGYHHHIAANIWNSRGADVRPEGVAGLETIEIIARDTTTRDAILGRAEHAGITIHNEATSTLLRDPWGTCLALRL